MDHLSNMNKIIILLIALLSIHSCNSKNKNDDSSRPNIILIMVDDLGKEWVSCYGAEDISTPNIDALAESREKFNNVYSMPQCTPTRLTLLTGQYPFRHGWVNHWDTPRWGGGVHFDETMYPSLGREMKKAGYKTCIAGKWQIDDFRIEPDALSKNGFDEYCMWTGYETGIPESANRYQDPYLYTSEGSKPYKQAFGPDIFKDFITNFIKSNKDEPMFIYYPMVLTHTPFVNTPLDSASTKLGKHKAMVKYTDLITGDIIQTLEDEGIRDNTIVIWTTDNGTTRAVSGTIDGVKVQGGKSRTIESGICEPFIVSWPNTIPSNATSNALIDFSDLYPTFLDIAGIAPHSETTIDGGKYVIDGRTFKETLLNASAPSPRKWILSMGGGNNAQLTPNGVENQYVFRDRVLRDERFKLYIDSNREAEKFFDLQNDRWERSNLIDSLNTKIRKDHFLKLFDVVKTFPHRDSDPKYNPNPPQSWDQKISKESQVWKI